MNLNISGDVRGLGLFVGIELVLDRVSLTPAANEASCIIIAKVSVSPNIVLAHFRTFPGLLRVVII